MGTTASFKMALTRLINEHSRENVSNTPDFILADVMVEALRTFEDAVVERTAWYGPGTQMGAEGPPAGAAPTAAGYSDVEPTMTYAAHPTDYPEPLKQPEHEAHGIGWAVKELQEGRIVRRRAWRLGGSFLMLDPPAYRPARSRRIIISQPNGDREHWVRDDESLLSIDWEIASENESSEPLREETSVGQEAYFSGVLPKDWYYTVPGEYATITPSGDVARKAIYVGRG